MYRSITLAAALLTASAGFAQSIGYVKGSTRGDSIYLINPDGTGDTKVYQAPRSGRFGGQIDRLSLRPDGSEVAFVLDGAHLMIQDVANGQPSGTAVEIPVSAGCQLYDPDYRSDGDLYVSDSCMNIWLVDTDGSSAAKVVDGANVQGLAARGNDLLYVDDSTGSGTGSLKLRTAGGTLSTVNTFGYTLPLFVDAVGDTGILSGQSSYETIGLTTGQESAGCTTGGMVKYSPDGSQMVYEFRNTLFVMNSDCSGAAFRLARGADAVAWRSN